MPRFNGTREITHNGKRGTAFRIPVISLSEKEARGRARGMMLLRFPGATGQIDILGSKSIDTRGAGIDEYEVEVFVPHKSKS